MTAHPAGCGCHACQPYTEWLVNELPLPLRRELEFYAVWATILLGCFAVWCLIAWGVWAAIR